jgi:hypothetical protein
MIFLGSKGWPARKADNLTAIYEPIVYKMWVLTTPWAFTVWHRDSFTFNLPSFTENSMSNYKDSK